MNRQIAILIDGGFLTKRLPKLVSSPGRLTPYNTVGIIRSMCRSHVNWLMGFSDDHWHRHIYRIFYYDAHPCVGQSHHPLSRKHIDYGKSDRADFQRGLFNQLRKQRNVALRLGEVSKHAGWTVRGDRLKKLLRAKPLLEELSGLPAADDGTVVIPADLAQRLNENSSAWAELEDWMVQLDLRQKGVDMRIGLDIASLTLKRLASTIILVAGDADFVPAAKLARREGLQFILDPLWQNVSPDLFEHIDGLHTALRRPGTVAIPADDNDEDVA
ncbi:MAG: NYN domain-containing protein [Pacificimonas sp.]